MAVPGKMWWVVMARPRWELLVFMKRWRPGLDTRLDTRLGGCRNTRLDAWLDARLNTCLYTRLDARLDA